MEPIEVAGYLLGQRTKQLTASYVRHDDRSGRQTGRIVWTDRGLWLVEQDDDYVMISGPEASEIRVGRGRWQRGPSIPLSLPDNPAAFLRPRHLPIWGRPQHDWRLAGPVTVERRTATLRLIHADDPDADGQLTADLDLCIVLELRLPGTRTTLTEVDYAISPEQQRLLARAEPTPQTEPLR
ncbi:hypothetical protein [Cryptosporangium phraense]|uniref:Uncharacterized protein n=1 Tax=Cryptosporangium phraense TaxID=2593070 RepID=A0A545AYU7_9ACTN|nr:hypothetical protein [Cryptosporangium phraense]TQS46509.1 hypothetical protein FL583_03745 [Cryptosporangium phraense]